MQTITCGDLAYLGGDLEHLAIHDPHDQEDCACRPRPALYPDPDVDRISALDYEDVCRELDQHPGRCEELAILPVDGLAEPVEIELCCSCADEFYRAMGRRTGEDVREWVRQRASEALALKGMHPEAIACAI